MPIFSWLNSCRKNHPSNPRASRRDFWRHASQVPCVEDLESRMLLAADLAVLPDQQFSVLSTSPDDAFIGTVQVNQLHLFFQIVGGDAVAFQIERNTGKIKVNDPARLMGKTLPETLTIKITDTDIPEHIATGIVTIFINRPPTFTDDEFKFSAAGTEVQPIGRLTATEKDPAQTLIYTILTGNDDHAFELNSATGLLTFSNVAGSNLLPYPRTLAVRVQDSSGSIPGFVTGSDTATVTITGNTRPKVDNQVFSVSPDIAAGSNIGIVKATDVNLNQTLTYSIVAGNDTNAFAIDSENGTIRINNFAAFQALTFPAEVTVQVKDNGLNLPGTSTATITITKDGSAFFSINTAPRTYRIGDQPIRVDPQADFHLGTNLVTSLKGGTLKVSVSSGKVQVVPETSGDERLTVVGRSILRGKTLVATIDKGTGRNLEITFTEAMTPETLQTLIRRIGFTAKGHAGSREVTLTVASLPGISSPALTKSRSIDVIKKR